MSIQHREDSIRDMKLERLGVTPPQDWNDVEQVRTAKKAEIGLACSAAIYAGIDVGGAHYSLTEHDQTELMAQFQRLGPCLTARGDTAPKHNPRRSGSRKPNRLDH